MLLRPQSKAMQKINKSKIQTQRHRSISRKRIHQSSCCFSDKFCTVCVVCFVMIYAIVCYFYVSGSLNIIKSKLPHSISKRIRLSHTKIDLNFTKLIDATNIKSDTNSDDIEASYLQWLHNPNTLCWNSNSRLTKSGKNSLSIIIVTILFNYDEPIQESFVQFIRNNRMTYALIHGYTYCELSNQILKQFNKSKQSNKLISKIYQINKIDNDEYFRILWYKMIFIEYLMQSCYAHHRHHQTHIQTYDQKCHNSGDHTNDNVYYLLMDSDSVIVNFDLQLESVIISTMMTSKNGLNDKNKYDILIGKDSVGINNGVSIYYQSDWTINVFLKYILNHSVILQSINDVTREQYAITLFKKNKPFEWDNHVTIDTQHALQILRYSRLNDNYNRHKDDNDDNESKFPLSFHFCEEEKQTFDKTHIIQCIMILSELQPLWIVKNILIDMKQRYYESNQLANIQIDGHAKTTDIYREYCLNPHFWTWKV